MLSNCCTVLLEMPCNQDVVFLCCDCSFQCLIHQNAALNNVSVQLYKGFPVFAWFNFLALSADLTACRLRSVAELLHVHNGACLVSVQYNRHHFFNDHCLLRVSRLTGCEHVAGHYSGQWCHHHLDTVSGLDCLLHHSPVPAAALHLDRAGHHSQICLPSGLLHLLPVCLLRHHPPLAGLPQDGKLFSIPKHLWQSRLGFCSAMVASSALGSASGSASSQYHFCLPSRDPTFMLLCSMTTATC